MTLKPLGRSINNLGMMNTIMNMTNLILRLKYRELVPQVWEQLGTVIKDVAQGKRKEALDMYMSVMDSELMKAEDALM